jgi:hypothetical protein
MRCANMVKVFVDKNGYTRFCDSGKVVDRWADRFRSNRPNMRRNSSL